MCRHTNQLPEDIGRLLAPGETVVWTGKGRPRFPRTVLLVDLLYAAGNVAAWWISYKPLIGILLMAGCPLLIGNIAYWIGYRTYKGAVYICTNRRHLIVKRRIGKILLDAIPRRVVEYISLGTRSLILYYEYSKHRRGDIELPRGYMELDDAEEALAIINASAEEEEPAAEQPEPHKALHIADLPYSREFRERLQQQLGEEEKLLFAATPSRRFGLAQLLGLAGVALICWLVYFNLDNTLTQADIDWGNFAIWAVAGAVFGGIFLLIACVPLLEWHHRRHSVFILTDRRACELSSHSGEIRRTWEATPELIKQATIRRNRTADFTFSLDHTQTSRSDAGNEESGVSGIPDAHKLISIINSLPPVK